MTATFYVGDAIEVVSKLPEKSVDLVLTSPPFLALRSYLPADHPDKALEGGSQSTPGEFIDWLIDVVEACDRVLAPHGSLCVELGDTYAGSGGAGGDYLAGGWRDGQNAANGSKYAEERFAKSDPKYGSSNFKGGGPGGTGWPLAKSLSLIPELFRLTLVYGFNPLTGRQTDRWRLRNVVRWVRPNPPVGALGDKFRPATSELMVFCKSAKRYFDLDSVRSGPVTAGTANGATLGAATVRGEHSGTLHTDDGPFVARWRCDFRQSEIPVVFPMARLTDSFEVVDLVGVQVGIEQAERSYVVDLQACRGSSASPTAVAVAVESLLPGLLPVGAAVVDPSASVCGAVLASPVGRTPDAVALKAAKVVGVEGRLVAPDRIAASIALDVNGTRCLALLIAPITSSHRANSTNRDLAKGQPDPHDPFRLAAGGHMGTHPAGAPPLDWWNIPPGGYEGAHYAVWPPELLIKPIKAMCPEKVCRVCGEPSRRTSESESFFENGEKTKGGRFSRTIEGEAPLGHRASIVTYRTTSEWTDCGHDDWRPGLVLDPFGGSGTTALVATGHGRDCVLIDLDERNFDLALQRVGPFILSRAESV